MTDTKRRPWPSRVCRFSGGNHALEAESFILLVYSCCFSVRDICCIRPDRAACGTGFDNDGALWCTDASFELLRESDGGGILVHKLAPLSGVGEVAGEASGRSGIERIPGGWRRNRWSARRCFASSD